MISSAENEAFAIEQYLQKNNPHITIIYFLVLVSSLGILIALPQIYFDISITVPGIIRPSSERTVLKSLVAGRIDSIFYREGELVNKGAPVFQINNPNVRGRTQLIIQQFKQQNDCIHDLQLLLKRAKNDHFIAAHFQTALYREKFYRFKNLLLEKKAVMEKLQKELSVAGFLFREKVIASKDLEDKQIEFARESASVNAFYNQQAAEWQQELLDFKMKAKELTAQSQQLIEEEKSYTVFAPVTGIIRNVNGQYSGEYIQAGEILCELSPEDQLIAECLVPAKQIEFIKISRSVQFFIESLNSSYFGLLHGRIISVDNDFSVQDNIRFFKVRCSFDKHFLRLKNGYRGSLKKGIALQARFIIARRSIGQLLFDKTEDWLNPSLLAAL